MTDPGLSNRLRQHSRRAGLMVGVSMALTIAICLGGAAIIYARLLPLSSDLVHIQAKERTPTPVPQAAQAGADGPAPTGAPQSEVVLRGETPPPAAQAIAPATSAAPQATQAAFKPDYQISAVQSVNLRPEPSKDNTPIRALPPGAPLQYLNKDQPTQDPNDAPRWMKFRTKEGDEGWVRQIDTERYQP